MPISSRITPHLWFDNNAEEAMNFYVAIFPNSKVLGTRIYKNCGPTGTEDCYICEFELDGFRLSAFNAGPVFKFNEAVSFMVHCENQAEVDHYWERLLADGGQESCCGWLKDKFGVAWQVVPKQLEEFLQDPDQEKSARAMRAMLSSVKFNIADLQKAFEGK
ncbi:VOC family protein [archaeon]|nr:MAG: VOC family protein [archaeon]